MRYVIVPAPVSPKKIDGQPYTEMAGSPPIQQPLPAISMHGYLMRYVINETTVAGEGAKARMQPKMGAGYAGSKAIGKLDRLFESAKPLDIVALEDADWERVKKIIEEMSFTPPHFGATLESLADAWMRASESPADAEAEVAKRRIDPPRGV